MMRSRLTKQKRLQVIVKNKNKDLSMLTLKSNILNLVLVGDMDDEDGNDEGDDEVNDKV